MNIALITTQQDPSTGGGHTFESSIIQGVQRQRCSHDFRAFDWSGQSLDLQLGLLDALPSEGAWLGEQSGAGLGPVSDRIDPLPYPVTSRRRAMAHRAHQSQGEKDLAGVLAAENIDFLWFPTPGCIDTTLPYAITVWDLEHRNKPFFPEVSSSGWTWDERETFYRRYLPRAAAVVVGTEVGKREVVDYYGVNPGNIVVNPFPVPPAFPAVEVDTLRLSQSSMQAIRGLEGQSFFLFPAQFWPHKNHANLLLALALLRDAHGLMPSLALTGSDKGNKPYIDSLIQNLNLETQVQCLGFVSREDLSLLYAHATALVFPSFFGPDNLPPLEAFAHGCPVLASDGEGPREQLGDGALFFDPVHPVAMAEAMVSVMRDGALRQRLIARGRERCRDRTVDAYITRMVAFFDRFEAIRFTWPAGYVHS